MNPEDDLGIWKRIQASDSKAFDTLFRQYFNYLYKYGLSLSSNEEETKDAIQDVFLGLWNNRKKLTIKSSVKYYLLQSFRRSVFNKNRSNSLVSLEEHHRDMWKTESVESSIMARESEDQLKFNIKQMAKVLTPRQREAIFLKFYDGMDSDEISQLMQIDKKAVYKLISTGITRYRKNLKKL